MNLFVKTLKRTEPQGGGTYNNHPSKLHGFEFGVYFCIVYFEIPERWHKLTTVKATLVARRPLS